MSDSPSPPDADVTFKRYVVSELDVLLRVSLREHLHLAGAAVPGGAR